MSDHVRRTRIRLGHDFTRLMCGHGQDVGQNVPPMTAKLMRRQYLRAGPLLAPGVRPAAGPWPNGNGTYHNFAIPLHADSSRVMCLSLSRTSHSAKAVSRLSRFPLAFPKHPALAPSLFRSPAFRLSLPIRFQSNLDKPPNRFSAARNVWLSSAPFINTPPRRRGTNAPHPTTRKWPRETPRPFGPRTRTFGVSGW
jgi:hypothetical protein